MCDLRHIGEAKHQRRALQAVSLPKRFCHGVVIAGRLLEMHQGSLNAFRRSPASSTNLPTKADASARMS
jgi:hypothetical protein